ncbi:MAG: YggS family pyridoxal phosphate-dependent enzyme [Planctomycetaceae bacterium]|jgi:pyridoxal phosphate enzyme (YggS family)|nr:YggS family pyridoxal phosphate-dependent enzyme [Planctomycetaceae bacterium]
MSVSDKIKFVRDKMADAARRSGRGSDDVKLIAVTKYVLADDWRIEEFIKNGCTDFGESRVQSLLDKIEYFDKKFLKSSSNIVYPSCLNFPESEHTNVTSQSDCSRAKPAANTGFGITEDRLSWHMIGNLQRNKIRKILSRISLIHSVDSERLAAAIDRVVVEELVGRPVRCLLEVAISCDETKHGFAPSEIFDVVGRLGQFRNLRVIGLMCMASLDADATQTRREFATVRNIAEKLKSEELPDNCSMDELSMGMSDDFEIAIEEGATIVRIGKLLYD